MNLPDLTDDVRKKMLEEIANDVGENKLYTSPRLSPKGVADYPGLLRQAAEKHNEGWLTAQLNQDGRLNEKETRRKPGKEFTVNVPVTAAQTLAEGEFNRFFVRGLCQFVLEGNDKAEVEVYRAKEVGKPRPESEEKIGKRFNAAAVLVDVQTSRDGVDTAMGVPAGPNSGLSFRIPTTKAE